MRPIADWKSAIRYTGLVIGAGALPFAPMTSSGFAKAQETGTITEAAASATPSAAERKKIREQELAALTRDIKISAERQEVIAQEIAELDQDRASLNSALIRTAERVQSLERDLAASEERFARLQENEDLVRVSLAERREVLAEVIAGLQRIGRKPPPALAVRPEDALSAVRSAILLGGILPEIRVEAEALAADLAELTSLKKHMAAERDRLTADASRLAEERARLGVLLADKKARHGRRTAALDEEKQKAEQLAGEATSLKSLIANLETEISSARKAAEQAKRAADKRRAKALSDSARLSPAIPFTKTRGKLPFPVQGVSLRSFGEDDGTGGQSKGISVQTRADARVIAPNDGWVVYAGPFRSYGQLLILNAGGGYHVLLAGMDAIDVELGQFVLAGEPVGIMGMRRTASAATLDIGSTRPVLYIEFRKDGTSIDSAPWWANTTDQKVGG